MVSWRHYNWNRGESHGGVIDQVEVVALYQSLSSRYQSSSMRVSRRHYQSSSRYVAVICSELQCVAECMQWVAEVCNLLVGAYGSGVSPRHYQSGTRCVAVCCSVLQWVAVSCSELQIVWSASWRSRQRSLSQVLSINYMLCCSVLQWVAVNYRMCDVLIGAKSGSMECALMCCSGLQCVAVCCSVLQCDAVCCNVLQCVAVVLQRVRSARRR